MQICSLGANLHPGGNLHSLASRSHGNKLCPYALKFDLEFNPRFSVLRRNSLCWNIQSGSNFLSTGFKCLPQYLYCGCAADTFITYKNQARKSIMLYFRSFRGVVVKLLDLKIRGRGLDPGLFKSFG